jgi:hypothetical protein
VVGAETLERNFKAIDRRPIQTLKVGQRVCWQDSATDLISARLPERLGAKSPFLGMTEKQESRSRLSEQ